MRRLAPAAMAALCSTSALAGTYWDGATNMIAYSDPYFAPQVDPQLGETYARFGVISFNYSSTGQINEGYVTPWVLMDPNNNYNSFLQLRLIDGTRDNGEIGPGDPCVELTWDKANQMGGNDDGSLDDRQQYEWTYNSCDQRPDPTLYNSGNKMGVEFLLNGPGGNDSANWMDMFSNDALPNDGGKYNVQIYWSTGTLYQPPWAKLIVTDLTQPGSGVIKDFDAMDSSYFYTDGAPDGFSVQLSGVFQQFGCETTDTAWVDTCVTGTFDNFFLYPSNSESEIIPYGSTTGMFFSPWGAAADLGPYGTVPFNLPPEWYFKGADYEFIFNAADNAAGVTAPQRYTPTGWQQDGSLNPNYIFQGGQIYGSFDFY